MYSMKMCNNRPCRKWIITEIYHVIISIFNVYAGENHLIEIETVHVD